MAKAIATLSLISHIRGKKLNPTSFSAGVKAIQLKAKGVKRLILIKNYGVSISMTKPHTHYRQLQTVIRRRLITVRRSRLNLNVLTRGRFNTIKLTPYTKTIMDLNANRNKNHVIWDTKTQTRNAFPDGQNFTAQWLSPTLKYVVSGQRKDARIFSKHRKTVKKLIRTVKQLKMRIRRKIKKKAIQIKRPKRL